VSIRAEQFRERATQCDRLASKIEDLFLKSTLADVAEQWREPADQVERFELDKAKSLPQSK